MREVQKSVLEQDAKTGKLYVYFIQAVENGLIKIGMSREPKTRFRGLQSGCPVTLRILGIIEGGHQLEKRLHRQFSRDRRSFFGLLLGGIASAFGVKTTAEVVKQASPIRIRTYSAPVKWIAEMPSGPPVVLKPGMRIVPLRTAYVQLGPDFGPPPNDPEADHLLCAQEIIPLEDIK